MSRVHINAPPGKYISQIRRTGYRKWETICEHRMTVEKAMSAAVLAMTPGHKRARVLFVADWYDPIVLMECSR